MTDRRVDLVDERIDFAIRLGQLADPQLVARRLCPMHYRLVAAPSWLAAHLRPTEPAELARMATLVFPLPGETAVWRFEWQGAMLAVDLEPALVASNTLFLRDAARAGLGVSVLPDWLVDEDLTAGDLVQLLPEVPVTLTTFDAAVWLALPTRRYVPARVRAVTDFLVDHLAG